MTNPIPTSRQFITTDGLLGLDRSAIPRMVLESSASSTGDGPFGQQAPTSIYPSNTNINPNLKTLINQHARWRNDYGTAVQVQVQIQRARRTMITTAPNYAFIREAYTSAVGYDSPGQVTAPTPNPRVSWQTEWGGGIDNGVKGDGPGGWVPNYGKFRLSTPESSLTMPLIRLEAGQSVSVRFVAALITPYLWWDNIPSGTKQFEMFAFSNTIRMTAYPEPITP